MGTLLDQVDRSLANFRPKNGREYVALQIARRFHDTHRLGRYLLAAQQHPKRVLLEAARQAILRQELNRTSAGDLFFEVLHEFERGGQT
jgi:hypothetical protein